MAVVSDTHGNIEGLRQAVTEILSKHSVDIFVHLGDEYKDAEVFDEFACEYLRVPGVFCEHYKEVSIPNRLLKRFDGWRFLISHTERSHANDLHDDLKPEELVARKQVDVVLYGHTHKPAVVERDEVLFVNPGHLKREDKKGYPLTYAIVNIGDKGMKVKIVELGSGKALEERGFKKRKA